MGREKGGLIKEALGRQGQSPDKDCISRNKTLELMIRKRQTDRETNVRTINLKTGHWNSL